MELTTFLKNDFSAAFGQRYLFINVLNKEYLELDSDPCC